MMNHLCKPASHGGLCPRLHGNRAAGSDFQDVLQNSDPLLQDVGRVSGQIEGLLLRDQLMARKGEIKREMKKGENRNEKCVSCQGRSESASENIPV